MLKFPAPMKYGELIDGVAQNAAHPTTFEIPPKEDRETRFQGDIVKIGLLHKEGQGERFWVTITHAHFGKTGNTYYEGSVDNDLTMFDIPYRGKIIFQPQNILTIDNRGATAN